MNKYKIAFGVSAIATGLAMTLSSVGATIIPLPSYADVINTTTTAFAGSLLPDLLPWAGLLAVITIVGIGLAALFGRILSGFSKVVGGRRSRGRGRRRR